jgi:predicted kinase
MTVVWSDAGPVHSSKAQFTIVCEIMATAHLIHGYLGAGKTTFSRRLESETSAIRFTHDEWMQRLYSDDPEQLFAEYAERVFSVMEDQWRRCLAVNLDVILDFGFWSRAEREIVPARSSVNWAPASSSIA